MTDTLIVENLAIYADNEIVQPISFRLSAKRPLTLLGETGSGKSLIAQAIMGDLPKGLAPQGKITFQGKTLDNPAVQRKQWGKSLTMLPQEPWLALNPLMRIDKQIIETYRDVAQTEDSHAKMQADLHNFGLSAHQRAYPHQLSGGMMQRVAFIASKAGGAHLLIADEPTKGLDSAQRDTLAQQLLAHHQQGGALLTITHDLELAKMLGGEVMILRAGEVVERGEMEVVLNHPQHPYTRDLIAAQPKCWPKRISSRLDSPLLSAEDVCVTRGGKSLFEHLSFTLHQGEVLGISGASGSGKSTLGQICLRGLTPDAGRIVYHQQHAPYRYQKLYQEPPAAFSPHISLQQHLEDLCALHRIDKQRIPPLLEKLRLAPSILKRKSNSVSGGELQRVALLRLLLLEPVFLFADEATSRLDCFTQAETLKLILELANTQQCAIMLVSHDVDLLTTCCDAIITI